jgi:hypothetical protein
MQGVWGLMRRLTLSNFFHLSRVLTKRVKVNTPSKCFLVYFFEYNNTYRYQVITFSIIDLYQESFQ